MNDPGKEAKNSSGESSESPRPAPEDCPHFAWSGDEGPVSKLGRWPRRWKCDTCGMVKTDADDQT